MTTHDHNHPHTANPGVLRDEVLRDDGNEHGAEALGAGAGGLAGGATGAVIGGAVAGPPGAVVGGAVGAAAGAGVGDKVQEDADVVDPADPAYPVR